MCGCYLISFIRDAAPRESGELLSNNFKKYEMCDHSNNLFYIPSENVFAISFVIYCVMYAISDVIVFYTAK